MTKQLQRLTFDLEGHIRDERNKPCRSASPLPMPPQLVSVKITRDIHTTADLYDRIHRALLRDRYLPIPLEADAYVCGRQAYTDGYVVTPIAFYRK